MNRISLGTYVDTKLVYTDGTADEKFEFLLLGASLGYLDRLEVDFTAGTELCISDGIELGTTLGKYSDIELGLS